MCIDSPYFFRVIEFLFMLFDNRMFESMFAISTFSSTSLDAEGLNIRFLPQAKLDAAKLIEIARDHKGAMKLQGGAEPGLTLAFKRGEAGNADALLMRIGELLEELQKALET